MCDYSLMGLPNRLAVSDELLVVHRFPTNTVGLTSPSEVAPPEREKIGLWALLKRCFAAPKNDTVTAVCIPPGSRLLLQDIPGNLCDQMDVGAVEPVVFTQLTANAYAHRDAVRFQNGRELSLQYLSVGQRVKVLSVSDEAQPAIPEDTRDRDLIFR